MDDFDGEDTDRDTDHGERFRARILASLRAFEDDDRDGEDDRDTDSDSDSDEDSDNSGRH